MPIHRGLPLAITSYRRGPPVRSEAVAVHDRQRRPLVQWYYCVTVDRAAN
jgi:hypothetical protein